MLFRSSARAVANARRTLARRAEAHAQPHAIVDVYGDRAGREKILELGKQDWTKLSLADKAQCMSQMQPVWTPFLSPSARSAIPCVHGCAQVAFRRMQRVRCVKRRVVLGGDRRLFL